MNSARPRPTNTFRICLWVALLAVGFACPARAAGAGDWTALSTTVFRSVGEVPGGSVTALTQDRDGYLWVGGQSGLSRWDGYRFHSYPPGDEVPGWVNVLHEDHAGRLWIGTNSGGLSRYEAAGDRFVTYSAGRAGLSANSVSSLADDGADGLWIGTAGGLDHRIDRTGTFEHFRHDVRAGGSLPDDFVYAVLRDYRGTLWVATRGGLARRDPGSSEFVIVIEFEGSRIQASVSVGYAISPRHGNTQTELYKSADLALYEAKRAGRNTWRLYSLESVRREANA